MAKNSYIRYDLAGYPFNGKYPPRDGDKNGNLYHGYRNPKEECLFYDFAVLGYDLMFSYHGKEYYFMVDEDCVWLSDENFTAMTQRFDSGNDVLENFMIEGTPLIQLINQLDECEPM